MYAHGAVFAEVKVDPELGQIRATRLVGAFAAGTIINPRLVRSQYYGGMIWGVSFALHERAVLDPRSGRVMNANLAEYHVPVNADVPSLEAILVEHGVCVLHGRICCAGAASFDLRHASTVQDVGIALASALVVTPE